MLIMPGIWDDDVPGHKIRSLPGAFIHSLFAEELEVCGLLDELVDSTAELSDAASELLDSAAADSASMTELLMGSWLRGMSTTTWLELLCDVSVCSELLCCAGVCSELLCRGSVALDDSGVVELPVVALLEVGWESSEAGVGAVSELADVLSSQAFSVKAPNMPSVAASVLLAANEMDLMPVIFFFSIFIFLPSVLNFYIRLLEGGDHAERESAALT